MQNLPICLNKDQTKKLITFLDCIDTITTVDESVLMTFKNDVVIYSKGHQVFLSEKDTVIKANMLHLNPDTRIKEKVLTDDTESAIIDIMKENKKKLKQVVLSKCEC